MTDQAGSVLARCKGVRPVRTAYTPFGNTSPRPSGSQLAFNGQWREADGRGYLLGNGYRAFHPSLQRFIQPDLLSPFGKGGAHAYAYCAAEPVNRLDPSGRSFTLLSVGLAVNLLSTAANAKSMLATPSKMARAASGFALLGVVSATVGLVVRSVAPEANHDVYSYVTYGFFAISAGTRLTDTRWMRRQVQGLGGWVASYNVAKAERTRPLPAGGIELQRLGGEGSPAPLAARGPRSGANRGRQRL